MIELPLFPFHAEIFSYAAVQERILIALFALLAMCAIQFVLHLVLKDRFGWRPVLEYIPHSIFAPITRRLNKAERGSSALFTRGAIILVFILWLVWLLNIGIGFATNILDNEEATKVIHFLVLCLSISPVAALLSVLGYGRAVTKSEKTAQQKAQKDNFFKRMALSSGLNLVHLDDHGLSRTALRQIVVILMTSCVAPMLAFIFTGVFGLMLYSFLNAAFLSSGKSLAKNSFAQALSWFPKLFHFMAGVIVSLIFTIAMPFAASAKFSKALGGWNAPKKDGFGAAYDGGRALNIMAHGLHVTLGGSYQDENAQGVYAPWLGADGATSQIKPVDILRGVYLCAIALLFLTISLYSILVLT